MINIKAKQSKRIISFGMLLSLFTAFYLFFWHDFQNIKNSIPQLFFFIALIVYQVRYFHLIHFVKKNRVTFQLVEKFKNPILIDTIVGLLLFCLLPIVLVFLNKRFNLFLGWTDFLSISLYFFGTWITLVSEKQRKKWKSNHPNSLFIDGLFKYANHINYFGETISFPAFCWLATGNIFVFLAVLIHQLIDFIFVQIPVQETYLKKKYPKDYTKIKNRKKLIPFMY